jgi:hypothetical protein
MDSPFNPGPFAPGIAPNLIPNPPGAVPEAQAPRDAVASLSPFSEPQDVDSIIKNLTLDRPLKLYIPNRDKYPDWDFRIINSIPSEIAAAHNKGWKEVSDPELTGLFNDLVAGTDKTGKPFRPILCARPRAVTQHVKERNRMQLRSLYAGMDPTNKDLGGKYTKNVDHRDGTSAQFDGPAWRIKIK